MEIVLIRLVKGEDVLLKKDSSAKATEITAAAKSTRPSSWLAEARPLSISTPEWPP